jgi:hypothetical protein
MTWDCWPYGRPEWEALGHRNIFIRSAFLRLWDTWDTSPVFLTSCVCACVRAHIRYKLTYKCPKCPKPYQILGFSIPSTLPIVSHQPSHVGKDVKLCRYPQFAALLKLKTRLSWSLRSLRMLQSASACCSLPSRLPARFSKLAYSVCCQLQGMTRCSPLSRNQRNRMSIAGIEAKQQTNRHFRGPLGPPGAQSVYGSRRRSSCGFPILFKHFLFLFRFWWLP